MGPTRHPLVRVVMTLVVALAIAEAVASPVSIADLKAAFLYNFVRFTEWPADVVPTGAVVTLCVAGDPDLLVSLGRVLHGKAIDGHKLVVRKVDADGSISSCQLLYAGDMDVKRARELVDAVKGVPMLTVSDLPAFAEMGGTAQLFMEGERMRFAVNVDAAARSKLRVSAQLLSLAKIVKDEHATSN